MCGSVISTVFSANFAKVAREGVRVIYSGTLVPEPPPLARFLHTKTWHAFCMPKLGTIFACVDARFLIC